MKMRDCVYLAAGLLLAVPLVCGAQSSGNPASAAAAQSGSAAGPQAELDRLPWEWGPFFQGGSGVSNRADFKFTSAGVRLGKVMTHEYLGSIFRGRFEYAGELMPYWEAFTPPPHIQAEKYTLGGVTYTYYAPIGGGNYHGVSITPIILRWDLHPRGRFVPWVQGAGGLVYTTHKFPPDVLVPHGTPGGTSVWNFTPQFGVGFHYFIRPQRSITFAANAIHISSASLGDVNPGVNASVQFQIGYTFWTRKP